jgi:hypothetical protein
MDNVIDKLCDDSVMNSTTNYYKNSITSIIKLQANIKGFLHRRKCKTRLVNIKNNFNNKKNFTSPAKPLIVIYQN